MDSQYDTNIAKKLYFSIFFSLREKSTRKLKSSTTNVDTTHRAAEELPTVPDKTNKSFGGDKVAVEWKILKDEMYKKFTAIIGTVYKEEIRQDVSRRKEKGQ